jgi:hypothetical protein
VVGEVKSDGVATTNATIVVAWDEKEKGRVILTETLAFVIE